MNISDFFIGICIAVLSGMGVGSGGLLTIYLTLACEFGQIEAQGINLLFFVLASASSLAVHVCRRKIPWASVGCQTLGALLGAALGAVTATHSNPEVIKLLFGIMLICVGVPSLLREIKSLAASRRDRAKK